MSYRCPCNRREEDRDGDHEGHAIMIARKIWVSYTLLDSYDPENRDPAPWMNPTDPDEEATAFSRDGVGGWSVTCELEAEEGIAIEAPYLHTALKKWLDLWRNPK